MSEWTLSRYGTRDLLHDAMAGEIERLTLKTQWQPIETAPRGDIEFLGWNGDFVDKTWEGWTDEGEPVYVRADWVSWEPTHWMPLPEPPK